MTPSPKTLKQSEPGAQQVGTAKSALRQVSVARSTLPDGLSHRRLAGVIAGTLILTTAASRRSWEAKAFFFKRIASQLRNAAVSSLVTHVSVVAVRLQRY